MPEILPVGRTTSASPVESVVRVMAVMAPDPKVKDPVVATVPAPTKVRSLISRLVPSTRILPASDPSLMVMEPSVPETSNSLKLIDAEVPLNSLAAIFRSSERSNSLFVVSYDNV